MENEKESYTQDDITLREKEKFNYEMWRKVDVTEPELSMAVFFCL